MGYKKVLVALDQSVSSKKALDELVKLSAGGRYKMDITALSVVPAYEGDLDMVWGADTLDALHDPAQQLLDEAEESAEAQGVKIEAVMREGDAYEEIVQYAEENNCDLIVLGRRGLTKLERALMGSVTARVIGYSKSDVLVFPRDCQIAWGKILLATDRSKFSEHAANRAIELAKAYGSELLVVYAVDVPPTQMEAAIHSAKEFMEGTKARAVAEGLKSETFVFPGPAYSVVTDLAKEKNVDVIVAGSHGRTGLSRLVMGSEVEKIIGLAPCPVLVTK